MSSPSSSPSSEGQRSPPSKMQAFGSSSSQSLQGFAGAGRGGGRVGPRTGSGGNEEPGIREIMEGNRPQLSDIGECVRDLSPSGRARALKKYLSAAPRCESPHFSEQELKGFYDDRGKWVQYEGLKIRANEALTAFQGASQLRFDEELKRMEKQMKKMGPSKTGTSRGGENLAGKPSLQNIQGRDWILPAGGPEGNLGQIVAEKFVSIYRESRSAQECMTKTVKAILGQLNTGGWTLTEGGKSREGKYRTLEDQWVNFFCEFIANLFGTQGAEREALLERSRRELKYQLEVSRRVHRESGSSQS